MRMMFRTWTKPNNNIEIHPLPMFAEWNYFACLQTNNPHTS